MKAELTPTLFLAGTDEMYKATLNRDASFEGIFFVCVKTTGVFCRPTCPARKPRKENVEFVRSAKEALDLGYRPCKICSPLKFYGTTPQWIGSILKEVEANPDIKLKDHDLQKRGLNPNRVRRWFIKHHGMTFQAYQRAIRISYAFGTIKYGDNRVINAAYDSGYDSLSGFTDAFKKTTGFSPGESSGHRIIHINRILTPLGPMLAGAVERGICLLEFTDRRILEYQLKQLSSLLKAGFVTGQNPYFDQLKKELDEYFTGMRKHFTVPVVTPGTPFQQSVWNILKKIPYGETRSYKQQAQKLGNPKAVRAVATANGYNRIAVIIPCHRVIGSNGELVGYGGGLHRKKYLLEMEQRVHSH